MPLGHNRDVRFGRAATGQPASRRGVVTAFNTSVLMGAGAGLLCLAFGALAQTTANAPEPAPQPGAAQPAAPQPPPAQGAAPQPAAQPPAAEAPNPSYKPGFIDAFGRWLQDGREKFDSQMKGAKEAFGEF